MKERPTFKVTALEPLENREMLSGLTAFRPQTHTAAYEARLAAVEQRHAARAASLGTIHVQGGPSATFQAQYRRLHAVPRGPAALRQQALAAQAAALANANANAAPSTPTKLAPALGFTPPTLGTSSLGGGSTATVKASSGPVTLASVRAELARATAQPTTTTKLNTVLPAGTLQAQAPSGAIATNPTPTPTPAPTASVLTRGDVVALTQAVNTFNASSTKGADASKDQAAVATLDSTLIALGGTVWSPSNAVNATAVANLQKAANAFVLGYTGGTDLTADALAWKGLNDALNGFAPATATTAANGVALPAAPAATPALSAVTGLVSALAHSGALKADTLTALTSALAAFSGGYTNGGNAASDKLAFDNLVTGLNSLAAGQWAQPAVSGATTPTDSTSPTAKSPVLFTAVRAPGV